jgi:NADPH-dependent 2,4-dienoyl-CoA reductase/sulfur reductase-like enzyme
VVTESEAAPRGDVIQVEVLNGAGVAGLAAEGTRFLRSRGFDVVLQGNHPPSDRTRIIDRIGDPEPARRVAAALGVDVERVESDVDPSRDLDVSVVLGADHAELPPFAPPEAR